MPKTPEQFQSIREERINEIKSVSLKLFAENGYHKTSISQITKEAKISKGLIYNYFESKQAILESIIADFVVSVWDYFDLNKDGTLTIEEFYFFIRKTFENLENNLEHWKLYTILSLQSDVIEIIKNGIDENTKKMGEILYDFFNKYFNEDSFEEITFFSALIKGTLLQYIAVPDKLFLKTAENKIIKYYNEKFSKNS
jgi:AcrR family transcriptional regulator